MCVNLMFFEFNVPFQSPVTRTSFKRRIVTLNSDTPFEEYHLLYTTIININHAEQNATIFIT